MRAWCRAMLLAFPGAVVTLSEAKGRGACQALPASTDEQMGLHDQQGEPGDDPAVA